MNSYLKIVSKMSEQQAQSNHHNNNDITSNNKWKAIKMANMRQIE